MEKIRLLNDGGYGDSELVNFPVVVNSAKRLLICGVHTGYLVSGLELINAGFSFVPEGVRLYFSIVEGECVAVDE